MLDIARGILIGIANIIPGVSGGTMAVSLGIYDRLVYALTDLFKHWRKSLATLLPIFLGVAVGIVGFTYAVEYLLRSYALPTCLAFIGLIWGGVPMLWHRYRQGLSGRNGKLPAAHLFLFCVLFAVSAFMPMLRPNQSASGDLQTNIAELLLLLVVGVVASATMVIPGISGSMIMMILGYYDRIIGTLKHFFDAAAQLDFSTVIQLGIPLAFLGVGILAGIFLIAKCIRYLLERFEALTFSGILGLVAAAPIAILYNTGALRDLALEGAVPRVAVGSVLLVACFVAIFSMDRKGK